MSIENIFFTQIVLELEVYDTILERGEDFN